MQQLLTSGKRPASIWYQGEEVRIDLHDRWVVLKSRHYLAIMNRTHPDRIRNRNNMPLRGCLFRRSLRALMNYRKHELKWYAKRGLNLPRVSLVDLPHRGIQ